jgi:hypothetical protein
MLAVFERFYCVLLLLCPESSILTAFMPGAHISDYFYVEKAGKSFILLESSKKVFFSLFWAHFGAQKREVTSF